MEAVLFAIALALLAAAGAGAALLLLPDKHRLTLLELTSLAILLGSAVISLSSFILGFAISGWLNRSTTAAIAIGLLVGGIKQRNRFDLVRWRSRTDRLASLIIALQFVVISWISLRLALGFDGLFIWESKAHLIFESFGSMPSTFINGSPRQYPHPDYPLLVPLTESWFYGWIGEANQGVAKLVSPLFYLSICGTLVASGARIGGSRSRGLIPALLFFFVPFVALRTAAGEADIPLGAFFLAAAAYLLEYRGSGNQRAFLLIGVLAGLMPWVKRDGLILWACLSGVSFLVAIPRRRWKELLPLIIPGICWIVIWRTFLIFDHATEHVEYFPVGWQALSSNIGRVPTILRAILDEMTAYPRWSLTWLIPLIGLVVLCLPTRRSGVRASTAIWLTLIAAPVLLYGSVYIFSAWQTYTEHIGSSLSRLLMHVAPLVLLGLAVLFRRGEQAVEAPDTETSVLATAGGAHVE